LNFELFYFMSTFNKILIRVIDLAIIFVVIWIGYSFYSLNQIKHIGSSCLLSRVFVLATDIHQASIDFLSYSLFHPPLPQKKLLFVGDIMLGRGVAKLMAKKGSYYPFARIGPFLYEADLTIGNLEGPIVKTVPKSSPHSMIFAFSSSSADTLAKAGFDLLSLANNHTLNMKTEGLEETRYFLEGAGIQPFGDPLQCNTNFVVSKDGIVFVGFNKTFSNSCPDAEITTTIEKLREKAPHKFIIVIMHWGKEYSLKNTIKQKDLAHKIIDAGADLIIGSHPHVVENIEEYKGKLIFYSLGNFVFDQYFSDNVQQGLAVEVIFEPSEILYILWPIKSTSSQPFLMDSMYRRGFLKKLADRSDSRLTEQIESGIIEAKPK